VGKHPRTSNGLKAATTDAGTIAQWWGQWPDANVGLAMGGSLRLIALDVDGPEGETSLASLLAQDGTLPETLEIKTGRGRHLLFTLPDAVDVRPSVGILGEHLDIRADGSYIVGPERYTPTGTSTGLPTKPRLLSCRIG